MTGSVHIIHGDARALPLTDDSVDLVVTSPPYFALRSYQDGGVHYAGQLGSEATPAEFVAALLEVTRECLRVLKPSGSLWVNLGDKYNAYNGNRGEGTIQRNRVRQSVDAGHGLDAKAIRPKSLIGIPWRYALACIDDLGLILRAEVVWSKPNGLPESVTDRVRRSHESWFHFTTQPRYFSAVDEIREAHAGEFLSSGARNARHKHGGTLPHEVADAWRDVPADVHRNAPGNRNPLGKLPGSVWTIPTEPLRVPDHLGVDHFAAFPTEWPRRIIQGWSPSTTPAVVLDPFGGTGTTALVAKALGRHGISVDKSADYCRLAEWRTNDPDQLAKAARVAKPPRQVDGQIGFEFDGAAS